jgi:hypothetical protein
MERPGRSLAVTDDRAVLIDPVSRVVPALSRSWIVTFGRETPEGFRPPSCSLRPERGRLE